MKKAADQFHLYGLVEVENADLGGKRRDGKRCRGVVGKSPLVVAISRNEKGHPIYMRMSIVNAFTSANVMAWSSTHLHPGTMVLSDMYNPFRILENVFAVHGWIKASDIHKDTNNKVFNWLNTMVGNVKKVIHGTYHAVSAKHLSGYLAEFCFRYNNRFNVGAMVVSLVKPSLKTNPRP